MRHLYRFSHAFENLEAGSNLIVEVRESNGIDKAATSLYWTMFGIFDPV